MDNQVTFDEDLQLTGIIRGFYEYLVENRLVATVTDRALVLRQASDTNSSMTISTVIELAREPEDN